MVNIKLSPSSWSVRMYRTIYEYLIAYSFKLARPNSVLGTEQTLVLGIFDFKCGEHLYRDPQRRFRFHKYFILQIAENRTINQYTTLLKSMHHTWFSKCMLHFDIK